jgi:hypothetical protein
MMNQFECWTLDGRRVIVLASPEHRWDFMLGFWRVVKYLPDPAQGTIRTI